MDTTNVSSRKEETTGREGDGRNCRKIVLTRKNKKSSNLPSRGAQVIHRCGDVRGCSSRGRGSAAARLTDSAKNEKRGTEDGDTLCYHDYSHLAMKVWARIYMCVYRHGTRESDRKMAREREREQHCAMLPCDSKVHLDYRFLSGLPSFFVYLWPHTNAPKCMWSLSSWRNVMAAHVPWSFSDMTWRLLGNLNIDWP